MLTEAIKKLQTAGIDTPELDARVLLEHACCKDRSFFVAHPEYQLSELERKNFENYIQRRLNREPVSQIVGRKEFYGRDFIVSKDVLTPRPETELVIDAAKSIFKPDSMLNILDLGTGSGCIILTLLREFPNSKGIAVDSSQNALAIAKQNAYNLNVSYVEFVLSKWCEKIEKQHFNLIVSNPPYIPSHESKNLEKELGFEPEQALYAGEDGLNAYREIADNLNEFSFDYAIFEIGISQEAEVIKIFSEKNMKHIQTLTDLADIPRTLVFEKVKFI